MTSCVGLNADTAATPSWTISCLVVGEEIPFPVKIRPNETIDQLKKAIMSERQHDFGSFHASYLGLYPVNIPDDDKLAENVKQKLTAEPPLVWLFTTSRLSRYYSTAPPQRTVHILVQLPQKGSTGWY